MNRLRLPHLIRVCEFACARGMDFSRSADANSSRVTDTLTHERQQQMQLAQRLLASPEVSQSAEMLHVSRQTPYQALKWVAEDTE